MKQTKAELNAYAVKHNKRIMAKRKKYKKEFAIDAKKRREERDKQRKKLKALKKK